MAPRTRVARHARIFAGSPLRCEPSIGSQVRLTRLDSAERAGHVLRTLLQAKLVSLRPTIRKSGVFELSVSSSPILSFCLRSDGYHFVLFTLFCDFDTLEVYGLFSIRPPVYGEYIRVEFQFIYMRISAGVTVDQLINATEKRSRHELHKQNTTSKVVRFLAGR